MDEINRYQKSIVESLEQENDKYTEVNNKLNFDSILTQAQHYNNVLIVIKKDMQHLRERSDKLIKRAIKLKMDKELQAIKLIHEKDKELQREKQLQPIVPNIN
jgi:hypothetical protein